MTGTIIFEGCLYHRHITVICLCLNVYFLSKLGYIQVSVASLRKTVDCIGHLTKFSQNMSRDILISLQNGITFHLVCAHTQTFKGPSVAILIFISNQPLLVSNKITEISHVIN